MYANMDCDLQCSNIFEELANLLSKSAFPVNSPLSALNVLASDGLVAVIQAMAERTNSGPRHHDQTVLEIQQQQQHSLFSQASWGRLEMKPERTKFKVQAH